MKLVLIAFVLAAGLFAQPALAPPQLGFLLDSGNSFRPVLGVAGSFLLADPAFNGVTSAAFSGSYGLLKTDTAVVAIGSQGQTLATMDAPPGPAWFAFSKDGSPAFVYLTAANLLFEWYGTGFQMVPFDCQLFPAGSALALSAPDAAHVAFLVQRSGVLWNVRVLVETGEADAQTALSGVTAPALQLASGDTIYSDTNGVVIRRADASEIHLAASLPASFSLAQMGTGWVTLTDLTTGAQYAVRTTAGHEALYALPHANLPEVRR